MKNTFCLLCCLFIFNHCTQQKPQFKIVVNMENIQKGAYLIMNDEYSDDQKKTTYYPDHSSFTITGEITDTSLVRLILVHPDSAQTGRHDGLSFFLVPGTTFVSAKDSLYRATLSGTRQNTDLQKFKDLSKNLPGADINGGRAIIRTMANYVKSNPTSLASLAAIQTVADIQPKLAPDLYQSLSREIRSNKLGKKVGADLFRINTLTAGAMAPEIIQRDTAGRIFKLSSLRGQYVLLNFWASWCGPCRQEHIGLRQIYNQYHARGLEIVGVSLDRPEQKQQWLHAIKKDQLTWINVSDLKYMMSEAAVSYGVQMIPDNVLIDPDGKIISRKLSETSLQYAMDSIFQSTTNR